MHASHSTNNSAASSCVRWTLSAPHRRLSNLISTWYGHHAQNQQQHQSCSDEENSDNDNCGATEGIYPQRTSKKLHSPKSASNPTIEGQSTKGSYHWMMGQKNEKTKNKEGKVVNSGEADKSGHGDGDGALHASGAASTAAPATAMSISREEDEHTRADGTFVNVGLIRWERERAAWRGNSKINKNGSGKSSHSSSSSSRKKSSKSSKSGSGTRPLEQSHVDEVIDIIFSNRWRAGLGGVGGLAGGMGVSTSASSSSAGNGRDEKKPEGTFPVSVPLPRMIDILVDLWEAEGMEA